MPLIENICIGTKVHISISLTKQISTDCSAHPHLVLNQYIACYLPQIHSTLIINELHSCGTKMFPQFE